MTFPPAPGVGLLLVGHGTRDVLGRQEFQRVAALLSNAVTDVPIEVCFLELAWPTILQATSRLVERGVRRIIVLPLLLFSAGHAERDIPRAIEAALEVLSRSKASEFGSVGTSPRVSPPPLFSYWQAPVLGGHPQIIELSARRYLEALAEASSEQTVAPAVASRPRARTLLLMVGRGSQDATANAEFDRFARLRFEREPADWLETCFLAMARPSLDEGLQMAATRQFERIVVQPHLLFSGELLNGLHQAVAQARQRAPDRQWIVTEHLGPDKLLVRALTDRANLSDAVRADGTDVVRPVHAPQQLGPNQPVDCHLSPTLSSTFNARASQPADLASPRSSV